MSICVVIREVYDRGTRNHPLPALRNVYEVTMTILDFLLLLLVAGICGSIAQSLVGFTRGGCLVSIVLGLIGALLGVWLARILRLPELLALQFGDQPFPSSGPSSARPFLSPC